MFLTPMQHSVVEAIRLGGEYVFPGSDNVRDHQDLEELVQARVIVEVSHNHFKDARNA